MRAIRFRSTRTSAESGFTVIEITVTLSIMLVVVGALLTIFDSTQRTQVFAQERSQTLDEIRLALDRMTKEIRQGSVVESASTTSFLGVDTYVNGVATHIHYTVSGTSLLREVNGSSSTLLANLNSSDVFTYAPDAASAQVITITLNVHPLRRPDTVVSLTSEVRLRNEGTE